MMFIYNNNQTKLNIFTYRMPSSLLLNPDLLSERGVINILYISTQSDRARIDGGVNSPIVVDGRWGTTLT